MVLLIQFGRFIVIVKVSDLDFDGPDWIGTVEDIVSKYWKLQRLV